MKVKLELSVEEANLVLTALSKLPYEVSVALIDGIKAQANAQIAEAQAKDAELKKAE